MLGKRGNLEAIDSAAYTSTANAILPYNFYDKDEKNLFFFTITSNVILFISFLF